MGVTILASGKRFSKMVSIAKKIAIENNPIATENNPVNNKILNISRVLPLVRSQLLSKDSIASLSSIAVACSDRDNLHMRYIPGITNASIPADTIISTNNDDTKTDGRRLKHFLNALKQ